MRSSDLQLLMVSPNPNWKPGDNISPPKGSMCQLDISKLSTTEVYKLLIGAVVPRPIAFVSTLSTSGTGNLAPFSFFNAVSSNPPCVVIAVSRKSDGEKKDTLRNIEETKQFVVNSANEWLIEPLVYCAGAFPYGVNEMQLVGLTPEPSVRVKPPRVKESALQFECELYKTVEIGDGSLGSTTLIIGRILFAHAHENIYRDGKIIYSEYKPVGRLGGFKYTSLGEIFDIPVPNVGGSAGGS